MVEPYFLKVDESYLQDVRALNELLEIAHHKDAMNAFKRKHISYWIEKVGTAKGAAAKMDIDESTVHRIQNKEQE